MVIFGMIEELLKLTKENNTLLKENNKMLKDIINFINVYLSKINSENQQDFERNIIANLISSHITRF